jgi:hypothetical protein
LSYKRQFKGSYEDAAKTTYILRGRDHQRGRTHLLYATFSIIRAQPFRLAIKVESRLYHVTVDYEISDEIKCTPESIGFYTAEDRMKSETVPFSRDKLLNPNAANLLFDLSSPTL